MKPTSRRAHELDPDCGRCAETKSLPLKVPPGKTLIERQKLRPVRLRLRSCLYKTKTSTIGAIGPRFLAHALTAIPVKSQHIYSFVNMCNPIINYVSYF